MSEKATGELVMAMAYPRRGERSEVASSSASPESEILASVCPALEVYLSACSGDVAAAAPGCSSVSAMVSMCRWAMVVCIPASGSAVPW